MGSAGRTKKKPRPKQKHDEPDRMMMPCWKKDSVGKDSTIWYGTYLIHVTLLSEWIVENHIVCYFLSRG